MSEFTTAAVIMTSKYGPNRIRKMGFYSQILINLKVGEHNTVKCIGDKDKGLISPFKSIQSGLFWNIVQNQIKTTKFPCMQ